MGFLEKWSAFWRQPNAERLEPLLASDDEEIRSALRPSLWGGKPLPNHPPAPCFHALAILAGTDPRGQHREAKGARAVELGLLALGDTPGDAGDRAQFALSASVRLWDLFLAAGAKPGKAELMKLADDTLSDSLWERAEWLGSMGVGTRSIRPHKAAGLFGRIWGAAARIDPSLALGSNMTRVFLSRCNGRNRWSWRAQLLCSPECRSGWSPMDRSGGPPLWLELMTAEGNEEAVSGALAEIMGEPGGPLDQDPRLCKEFLGERMSLAHARLFLSVGARPPTQEEARSLPWAGMETPTGASLEARWAERGERLAPARDGLSDWLWRATRDLMDFEDLADDELETGAYAKSSHQQTARWRDEVFGLIEFAWDRGGDPFWVGPDGSSAMDELRARRGYQSWVARAEREALEAQGLAARGAAPSRSL